MAGERCKDMNWTVTACADGTFTLDQAQLAVLMDIRDELRAMNAKLAVLQCSNFLRIPAKLDRIGKNTERKNPPRKTKTI